MRKLLSIAALAAATMLWTGCQGPTVMPTEGRHATIAVQGSVPENPDPVDRTPPLVNNAWEPKGIEEFDAKADAAIQEVKLNTIYFAYDKSLIGDVERKKLEDIYAALKANSEAVLRVEGHCDERGSEKYNLSLGERRALSVKNYLVKMGIPGHRIKTLSFGEGKPAAFGKTEEAYRKNRRAENYLETSRTVTKAE